MPGTAGGFGHSEVTDAGKRARDDRNLVRITVAGRQATLDGVENGDHPSGQTELAYTYGEPPACSVTEAILTHLTEQGGRHVLRAYGDRPCSEAENPRVCEPS
ncbi:hypothetical protein ABZ137_14790 [Streptomyces bobili]|uniref:hypothetical protein n=1 Tax=Streptomyces bobili TaxID=67280 RepID=UPI0033BF7D56